MRLRSKKQQISNYAKSIEVLDIDRKDSTSESDSDSSESDDLESLATQLGQEMQQSLSQNQNATSDMPFVIDRNPITLQSASTLQDEADKSNENVKKIEKLLPASSLQVDVDLSDIYVSLDNMDKPKRKDEQTKSRCKIPKEPVREQLFLKKKTSDLLQKSVIGTIFEACDTVPTYQDSLRQVKKQRKAERALTKGKGWFDLPATEITEEHKNSLDILQMRKVLDPKRKYKSLDYRGTPKYFQMGRIADDAVDFYASRVPKKERKATLVDELLADAQFRRYNKRKYTEVVEAKRGAKGAYRHMKRLKKKKRA